MKPAPSSSKSEERIAKTPCHNPVKKTGVRGLITLTLIVIGAMAPAATATNPASAITNDDNSAEKTSVALPGVMISHTPVPVHPFVDSAALQKSKLEIFVSDAGSNVVYIYNQHGKLLGQLTGLSEPQGITSDGKGNLYVADTADNDIKIYAPPYKHAPKVLNDPGQYPTDVSALDDGAFLAVTNIISASGGPGSVTLYKKGHTGPTISSSDFARMYFCAFDAKGNLYVDGEDASGNFVIGEIPHLTTGGKKLKTLSYNATIGFPGGIAVTTGGKIAILDQEADAIYTFNPPVKGSLGSPIATTPLDGASGPATFAFTQSNKDLWTIDAGADSAAVDEFAYPAGGNPVKTVPVNEGELIGIAIVPAAKP